MGVPGIKILIVDNYDSFTYNIAHTIRRFPGSNLQIIEAGRIDLAEIDSFDKIIFSPGTDVPRHRNVMNRILNDYAGKKSILGICLGLQAIVIFYGGRLKLLEEVVHGRKKMCKVFLGRDTILPHLHTDSIVTSLDSTFRNDPYIKQYFRNGITVDNINLT